jgi:N12 class adenine-specific DNA methylase
MSLIADPTIILQDEMQLSGGIEDFDDYMGVFGEEQLDPDLNLIIQYEKLLRGDTFDYVEEIKLGI